MAAKTSHVLSYIKLKSSSLKRRIDLYKQELHPTPDESELLDLYLQRIDDWTTAVLEISVANSASGHSGLTSSQLSDVRSQNADAISDPQDRDARSDDDSSFSDLQ
ncbi:hypothetical protein ADUPG1_008316 [Aduncisulcus paluster]|uniref:Uncharacterized protein n=1 Tax=Aduncisulcus paluster TaxID=2918883 RepID=A0ABQ5KSU4_9EUKA|nr:hypothetical protein ADUPG1_008316 [Aduncisulcus paluster]